MVGRHNEAATNHAHDGGRREAGFTLAVPRSRGAITGILLLALGAWGALLPLIGPHFHFGYGPDNSTFHMTAARFWLQILPGVVAAVAGLVLLMGGNRVTGMLSAVLGCAAGAWYVVGPTLADLRTRGYLGAALGNSDRQHLDAIAAFYGLGAVILFLAAIAAGRFSVVGVRDLRAHDNRHRDHDDQASREPAAPVFPATREVPVTTTNVRPSNVPTVITLPADQTASAPLSPAAVADPGHR